MLVVLYSLQVADKVEETSAVIKSGSSGDNAAYTVTDTLCESTEAYNKVLYAADALYCTGNSCMAALVLDPGASAHTPLPARSMLLVCLIQQHTRLPCALLWSFDCAEGAHGKRISKDESTIKDTDTGSSPDDDRYRWLEVAGVAVVIILGAAMMIVGIGCASVAVCGGHFVCVMAVTYIMWSTLL
jgi:hypothetical protein